MSHKKHCQRKPKLEKQVKQQMENETSNKKQVNTKQANRNKQIESVSISSR